MRYFENESEVNTIDGLNIENRVDRIEMYGSLNITKDKSGLALAKQLIAQLQSIVMVLESEGEALPDAIQTVSPTEVDNPFSTD